MSVIFGRTCFAGVNGAFVGKIVRRSDSFRTLQVENLRIEFATEVRIPMLAKVTRTVIFTSGQMFISNVDVRSTHVNTSCLNRVLEQLLTESVESQTFLL